MRVGALRDDSKNSYIGDYLACEQALSSGEDGWAGREGHPPAPRERAFPQARDFLANTI